MRPLFRQHFPTLFIFKIQLELIFNQNYNLFCPIFHHNVQNKQKSFFFHFCFNLVRVTYTGLCFLLFFFIKLLRCEKSEKPLSLLAIKYRPTIRGIHFPLHRQPTGEQVFLFSYCTPFEVLYKAKLVFQFWIEQRRIAVYYLRFKSCSEDGINGNALHSKWKLRLSS